MTLSPEDQADPFLVSRLSERAPVHDPASCARQPCSRCRPRGERRIPKRVDHDAAPYVDRSSSPFAPLPPLLIGHARQVPTNLAKAMLTLADAIRDHGNDRWARLLAWEHRTIGVSLTCHEQGVDPDEDDPKPAVSLTEEKYRAEEAAASRYAEQTRQAAASLPTLLAQLPTSEYRVKKTVQSLRFLLAVAETRKQRRLLSREQTAAQVALDGWCKSCYRVGVFDLIDKRPTGEPYFVDLCRWCGSHKGALPQPPIDMVKIHHRIHVRTKAS